ncbi:MAG: hypothetical protein JO362_12085 [Streptomycetaceae bacterium]|nr:hypothetical protein [Streptomycetaceae bacterium]
MDTPAEHRAAARRLLDALPDQLPRKEERIADAVARALWHSGLLAPGPLTSSNAFVAARDAFTCLAHHLDETTSGHGAGRLLLLVTADHEDFAPHPRPSRQEFRVRDAATSLLTFLQWHCESEPDHVLGVALRFHAEQTARAAVAVTPATADGAALLHLTLQPWEPGVAAVCGTQLDQRLAAGAGGQHGLTQCDGCFGVTPLDPAAVLTRAERQAWVVYLNQHEEGRT